LATAREVSVPLGDIWHLDEVFVKIRGERHCSWRPAVHDGVLGSGPPDPSRRTRFSVFSRTSKNPIHSQISVDFAAPEPSDVQMFL
jgi:hypothetical protein